MATERQLAANRANAKRSTGPKTNAGRYASSRNAVRHGLASSTESRQLIPIDIDDLADVLIDQEADEAQIVSAHQAAQAHVTLLRISAVRAALFASFDPKGNIDELRQLLALDRYERVARGRRRRAAKRICAE